MLSWKDLVVGQKVHYLEEDGPDRSELLCEVITKQSDHCILKVLGWFFGGKFTSDKEDPWNLYIDDDTSSVEIWKEPKTDSAA
jgi:hypothetical protein